MTKNIGARLRKAGVADTQFLRLSKKWALAFDNAQWIVQRRKAPGKKGGECRWAAVSFVASNKDILWRVLREKGAEIDPAAREYIDAMPDTFREWVSVPPARRFKAGHSAMTGVAAACEHPRRPTAISLIADGPRHVTHVHGAAMYGRSGCGPVRVLEIL